MDEIPTDPTEADQDTTHSEDTETSETVEPTEEEAQPLPVSYRTHLGAPINDTFRVQ